MTARKFSHRRPNILLRAWPLTLCLLGGSLGFTGCTGEEPELEELSELRDERGNLLRRFMAVQNGIRPVQAAALDSPGVRTAQDSFYAVLRSAMIANDPAAAELLDRSRRIGADLDRLSRPVRVIPDVADEPVMKTPDRQVVAHELVEAEQELRPQVERAMMQPEVAEAFATLQDSLLVTMKRIDPNSAALIERMNEIAKRIRQIETEMARLEGDR